MYNLKFDAILNKIKRDFNKIKTKEDNLSYSIPEYVPRYGRIEKQENSSQYTNESDKLSEKWHQELRQYKIQKWKKYLNREKQNVDSECGSAIISFKTPPLSPVKKKDVIRHFRKVVYKKNKARLDWEYRWKEKLQAKIRDKGLFFNDYRRKWFPPIDEMKQAATKKFKSTLSSISLYSDTSSAVRTTPYKRTSKRRKRKQSRFFDDPKIEIENKKFPPWVKWLCLTNEILENSHWLDRRDEAPFTGTFFFEDKVILRQLPEHRKYEEIQRIADRLNDINMEEKFSENKRIALASRGYFQAFHSGKLIAHQAPAWGGQTEAWGCWMLVNGKVCIQRKDVNRYARTTYIRSWDVSGGKLIGDIAFVHGGPRVITIRAKTDVELILLTKNDFEATMGREHQREMMQTLEAMALFPYFRSFSTYDYRDWHFNSKFVIYTPNEIIRGIKRDLAPKNVHFIIDGEGAIIDRVLVKKVKNRLELCENQKLLGQDIPKDVEQIFVQTFRVVRGGIVGLGDITTRKLFISTTPMIALIVRKNIVDYYDSADRYWDKIINEINRKYPSPQEIIDMINSSRKWESNKKKLFNSYFKNDIREKYSNSIHNVPIPCRSEDTTWSEKELKEKVKPFEHLLGPNIYKTKMPEFSEMLKQERDYFYHRMQRLVDLELKQKRDAVVRNVKKTQRKIFDLRGINEKMINDNTYVNNKKEDKFSSVSSDIISNEPISSSVSSTIKSHASVPVHEENSTTIDTKSSLFSDFESINPQYKEWINSDVLPGLYGINFLPENKEQDELHGTKKQMKSYYQTILSTMKNL